MADKRENDMSEITNPIYIRCLDSARDSKVVTPNNLINSGMNAILNAQDLNTAMKTGLYVASFEVDNKPINDYGMVEVLKTSIYIIQKFYCLNQNKVFIRRSIDNGSKFTDWIEIL